MDSCETARYSLFRSQPNRVQFARLRAAPSILHINGTPGTGRLLSPEYNDQNITNGGPPCSSSVYSFKRPRSIYVVLDEIEQVRHLLEIRGDVGVVPSEVRVVELDVDHVLDGALR